MESLGCATETNRNSNLQHGSRWKIELKLGLYFHNTVVSLFSIAFIVNRCFLRTARLSSTTVHHISTSSEKGERSWEEVTLKVWLPVTHKHICVSWVILCQVYVQQHEYVTHDISQVSFFKLPPVWRSTVRWSWTWVLFFYLILRNSKAELESNPQVKVQQSLCIFTFSCPVGL